MAIRAGETQPIIDGMPGGDPNAYQAPLEGPAPVSGAGLDPSKVVGHPSNQFNSVGAAYKQLLESTAGSSEGTAEEIAEKRQHVAEQAVAASGLIEMPDSVKRDIEAQKAARADETAPAQNDSMTYFGGYTGQRMSQMPGARYEAGAPIPLNQLQNPQEGDPQVPHLGPGDPRGQ